MSQKSIDYGRDIPIQIDDMLKMRRYYNEGTNIVYFTSYLEEYMLKKYNDTSGKEREDFKTLVCRPGRVIILPHGCYKVHDRDGNTKIKLRDLTGTDR